MTEIISQLTAATAVASAIAPPSKNREGDVESDCGLGVLEGILETPLIQLHNQGVDIQLKSLSLVGRNGDGPKQEPAPPCGIPRAALL